VGLAALRRLDIRGTRVTDSEVLARLDGCEIVSSGTFRRRKGNVGRT
jgi:hypothetical protein